MFAISCACELSMKDMFNNLKADYISGCSWGFDSSDERCH